MQNDCEQSRMITFRPQPVWTDERVEQLKELWGEGLSASQCARALGGGISRNSVIGKAHRLGLAGRTAYRKPYVSKPRIKPMRPEPPKEAPPPVLDAKGNRLTLMTARSGVCRFIEDEPAKAHSPICGNATGSAEVSWCEFHRLKVYQPKHDQANRQRQAEKIAGAAQ